ncbi:hypothetical protein [Nocardiopsis sp. FR4]|uniref:hypothetical protein n=1 Tax=Nocardiopsis sp. FR4 TaxID=2605985 RepID=UPI001356D25B|nr:hypothetical protein [Nocardiopsis sp. FR4]
MPSELPAWLASPGLWIGGIAALVTGLTVIGIGARKVVRLLRRMGHLIDDLMGEPPRQGHPEGRPGLMDRVTSLEKEVKVVSHEVQFNTGTSLKDKVREVKEVVDKLAAREQTAPAQRDTAAHPESRNRT